MPGEPELIERIYEAAALPERWPAVLSALGQACGAAGGLFFTQSPTGGAWMAAPEVAWIIEDYIAQGWMPDNVRGAPMIAELHPGFRTDGDYRSADERAKLPVYRDFLIPNGIDAAAGTVFQGVADDAVVLTLEQFPSHVSASAAVPVLDRLRPHLGRALSLTAHLRAQADASAVAALELAGVPAAVVARDGGLRVANDRFAARLAAAVDTRAGRLRFADRIVQARLDAALETLDGAAGVRSVAVATRDNAAPFALHLLPLRRAARDVFGADGVLVLLAEAANASVPGADLLRLLFDLTPTEARLTRLLLQGRSQAEAAAQLRITDNTARTHIRRVFGKTGVARQAELVRLLAGLGAPA